MRKFLFIVVILLSIIPGVAKVHSPELSSKECTDANTLSKAALTVAERHIGVKETGYNRGKDVEKIQLRGGGRKGESWCAYFVYSCYDIAADWLHIDNPLKKTGAVCLQLKHAMRSPNLEIIWTDKNQVVKALPGDIMIMKKGHFSRKKHAGRRWLGHTGIVKYQVQDSLHNIEGNTNDRGTRNSSGIDGVYLKSRTLHKSGSLQIIALLRVK